MSKTSKTQLPSAEQRWTRADGKQIVDEWRSSGLTLPEFARRVGLNVDRIRWWSKQFGKSKRTGTSRPKFVPAVVQVPSLVASGAAVVIRLPNGVSIELPDDRLAASAAVAALVAELMGGRS